MRFESESNVCLMIFCLSTMQLIQLFTWRGHEAKASEDQEERAQPTTAPKLWRLLKENQPGNFLPRHRQYAAANLERIAQRQRDCYSRCEASGSVASASPIREWAGPQQLFGRTAQGHPPSPSRTRTPPEP